MTRERWPMILVRRRCYAAVAGVLGAVACGENSQAAPDPPSQLVAIGGNGQSWFFNNPLPAQLSVRALDVDNESVHGVVVNWAVTSGGGGVSPAQSTTDANGVASATDSIGSSTLQQVTATLAVMPSATVAFMETATTPPTTAAVSVNDNSFSPTSVVIQTGGTVTWTWGGANTHNLTFTGGPTPRPANQPNQTSGTAARTIAIVGKYDVACTNHAGMTGTVTVVH